MDVDWLTEEVVEVDWDVVLVVVGVMVEIVRAGVTSQTRKVVLA